MKLKTKIEKHIMTLFGIMKQPLLTLLLLVTSASTTVAQENNVALMACQTTKDEVLVDSSSKFMYDCDCEAFDETADSGNLMLQPGSYILTCISTCGEFCNEVPMSDSDSEMEKVCAQPGLIYAFDNLTGFTYFRGETFQYTQGRSELLERRVLLSDASTLEGCDYMIGDQKCGACNFTACPEGSTGVGYQFLLDCQNIESDAIVDFCETPTPNSKNGNIPMGSVLQILNQDFFRECTPFPTAAPTTATSSSAMLLPSWKYLMVFAGVMTTYSSLLP